ncbi:MAG TPA: NADPH-dependent FMN reductase [Longimicrobium sp.]|nr:NADPH-dependent FMN reductase [Longimicrobium sp.]
MQMRVMGIAGSIRRGSFNRALLEAAVELAPEGMRIVPWDRLHEVPMYDSGLESDELRPEPVADLKRAIAEADALLMVTPEYNYSVPGVLKNAIDWASRPGYRSVFVGKPVAIMGASGSAMGTARAQIHLREIMYATLARVMPHPGVLVSLAPAKFQDGRLADEQTRTFVANFLRDFQAYVGGPHPLA